jgi:hypothetical protein
VISAFSVLENHETPRNNASGPGDSLIAAPREVLFVELRVQETPPADWLMPGNHRLPEHLQAGGFPAIIDGMMDQRMR